MINYGVIGVGNCGGQIAKHVADDLHKPAVAINTSEQDLDQVGKDVIQLLVGNNKGAGQNRTSAQAILKKEINSVIEKEDFKNFLEGKELIFIASSTGGGTGSGITPILYKILSSLTSAVIIMIGVLPTIGEGKGVQENTASWLNDIYNVIKDTRYMLYDNNRVNGSSITMFDDINNAVVHDINVISGLYNHSTRFASIDDRDMLTILRPSGRIVLASVENITEKDLDTDTIEDMIVNDLKTNYHCESDRDKICTNTALIVNLSDKMNETLDMNVPKVHEFIGEPRSTGFKHISINEDSAIENNVFFIATGLSPVNDRIIKIAERIHEIEEAEKEIPTATALDSLNIKKAELPDDTIPDDPDVLSVFNEFDI